MSKFQLKVPEKKDRRLHNRVQKSGFVEWRLLDGEESIFGQAELVDLSLSGVAISIQSNVLKKGDVLQLTIHEGMSSYTISGFVIQFRIQNDSHLKLNNLVILRVTHLPQMTFDWLNILTDLNQKSAS